MGRQIGSIFILCVGGCTLWCYSRSEGLWLDCSIELGLSERLYQSFYSFHRFIFVGCNGSSLVGRR